MKMFRNLYTKAQEMSAEKVLDTNSITTALSTEMDDLKEAWRKDQKNIFFSDIMQQKPTAQKAIYVRDSANLSSEIYTI